jgi:hypothetical protein
VATKVEWWAFVGTKNILDGPLQQKDANFLCVSFETHALLKYTTIINAGLLSFLTIFRGYYLIQLQPI